MTSERMRHLLSASDLDAANAYRILDTAKAFLEVSRRPIRKVPTLRGKTVINCFFEASTRTRTSFELAGKRLGADVVNMGGAGSSTSKGETLKDTVATLDAMHADVIVVRHGASGAPHYVAERARAAVVNAGDGMHEHPTQALLDAFTIRQHLGKLEGLASHHRRAISSTAASHARTPSCSPCWARTFPLPVRARCCLFRKLPLAFAATTA